MIFEVFILGFRPFFAGFWRLVLVLLTASSTLIYGLTAANLIFNKFFCMLWVCTAHLLSQFRSFKKSGKQKTPFGIVKRHW